MLLQSQLLQMREKKKLIYSQTLYSCWPRLAHMSLDPTLETSKLLHHKPRLIHTILEHSFHFYIL